MPSSFPTLPRNREGGACARVLVVCVGNVCRSPMAEFVLRRRLDRPKWVIESAGLAALAGRPINPFAESILAEHGMSGQVHVARQVTPEMVREAALILVMEREHLDAMHALAPQAVGKTYLLGHWHEAVEIPDPYRQPRCVFSDVFWMIDKTAASWCAHLDDARPRRTS